MPRKTKAMSDTETLLTFPCDFPVKVMGRNDPAFEAKVVELVRMHVPDIGEGAVRSRTSQGDKYLAVTVTLRITSKEQIDAVYRTLTGCAEILMVL